MLLSDFIRHELGLTGTHVGCEHGVCGCCTVIIDGSAGRSCLAFAVQAEDADIRTIENVAEPDGTLHPVQQAFRECHGLQCGYCTPGFVMSILDYLEDTPNRTSPNKPSAGSCRATCAAAPATRTSWPPSAAAQSSCANRERNGGHSRVGAPVRRTDRAQRRSRLLRGEGSFIDDIDLPGALHVAFAAAQSQGQGSARWTRPPPKLSTAWSGLYLREYRRARCSAAPADPESRPDASQDPASARPGRRVLCRAVHRDGGGGRPLCRRGCSAPDRYRLRPPSGRDGPRKGGRGLRPARAPGRTQQHRRHFPCRDRQYRRGVRRSRARHADQDPARAQHGGADGMPRHRGALGSGDRRAHGLGQHAVDALGTWRPGHRAPDRRGQGARDRAECWRRLRPEDHDVLPGRTAGSAGLDGARAPGQVHRGQGRELHRLVPGADADPHPRARGHEGWPRDRPEGRLPCTIPGRSFLTESPSPR